MKKTKVLLNWDTSRKDLLEPFLQLKDEIEFVIIWGKEDKVHHPFEQVFFTDYKTPYQLLKEVQPDKILFFNINSFPQVALNLAARNSGIPTYVMHHGLHHSDNLKINRHREKQGLHKKGKVVNNFSTLLFYFSAIKLKNIDQVFPFMRFAWLRQRRDRLIAVQKCPFDGRLPERFINLSPHNAIIAKKVNHLPDDDKFIYIGHPFFDKIIQQLNAYKSGSVRSKERYFLLIDFPNNEDHLYFRLMTGEKKKEFYKNLSSLAKSMGCRLKVKLHPFGYNSPNNYKDENIDLVHDADMASLIHHAEMCFSFFSTLIIPIVYHKKICFLFQVGDELQIQKELVELGVSRTLATEEISKEDLVIGIDSINEKSYQLFIERYLYYTDGKSTDRLKDILLSA